MLKTRSLVAGYGKLQVLFGVDIDTELNGITAIIGPNGSGKSTLLKAIFGLADIFEGKIFLGEKEITDIPSHERVKHGLVYVPQVENVFVNLTVEENLLMAGYLLSKDELVKRREEVLELFPVLKKYYKKKVWTLSGGERQMLAIAMGLMKKPKIIMLDEPSANLAPKLASELFNKILELKKNYTVVLVEQNAKKALEISDKAYVLVGGRKVYEGSPKKILEDPEFAATFLGVKKS